MQVAPEIFELFDRLENGHVNPRQRLESCVKQLKTIASSNGWRRMVPDHPVKLSGSSFEELGAEYLADGTGVLVHYRAGYFGDVPGVDPLQICLISNRGELRDSFECSVSTRDTRMHFVPGTRPLLQPALVQSPAGQMVVIRLGVPTNFYSQRDGTTLTEIHTNLSTQEGTLLWKRQGLSRHLIRREQFHRIWPDVDNPFVSITTRFGTGGK